MRRVLLIVVVLLPTSSNAQVPPTDPGGLEGITVTDVSWSGNNVTKDFVIARELEIQEGRPFHAAAMADDVQRLENLGIFATIQAKPTRVGDGVTVEYTFVEMPSYIPYLAFRFTEENGWSIGPALSSVNLLGRDITVSGRVLFGGTTTFIVDGSYPWMFGDHVSLDLSARYLIRDDELRDFEERSTEFTPWMGTYLGKNGRFKGAFSYFRMQADQDGITLSEDNVDDLFRLGVRLGYDTRDSWVVPHSGWKNELEVMKTGGFLPGDGDFWSFTSDIQRFQPLGKHTFAIGGLLTLQSGTVGQDIPSYLQYTLGGANSIRGYDIDELGRELFGKNQLIATAEYQHTVIPLRELKILRWSFRTGLHLATFIDTGSAWDDPEQFHRDRFRTGYGVGVRIIVPGSEMVRLDFGFSERSILFHFGPWSKFTAQRFRLR